MALDILIIPAMSPECERLFSGGRHLYSISWTGLHKHTVKIVSAEPTELAGRMTTLSYLLCFVQVYSVQTIARMAVFPARLGYVGRLGKWI